MMQNQGDTEFVEVVGDAAVLTTARAVENAASGVAENGNGDPAGKKQLTPRARGDRMTTVEAPADSADATMRIRKLRCAKHRLPYATVDYERRALIIVARHHNEWCENIIPLLDLGLQPLDPSTGSGKTGGRSKKQSIAPEASGTTE